MLSLQLRRSASTKASRDNKGTASGKQVGNQWRQFSTRTRNRTSKPSNLDSNLSSTTDCDGSGNLLNFSVSQFHHLLNEDTKNTHHRSV